MRPAVKLFLPLLLITALLLAGCSPVDFFSADTLLRAPRLTGVNAALQQAFEAAVGKDVFLVSPLTGAHRSAYILKDCNGDKVEEAFVFYVRHGAENTIHIHLLENAAGEWVSSADIAGNGSEVYKAEFFNIDGDEDLEIAVTWTVSDSRRDKTLSLYKLDFSRAGYVDLINPLASVQVFDYFVSDFDRDGQNELFYVYYDSTEEKNGAYAKLLKYSEADTVLFPVNEVKFDGRASNLLAVKYDYADGRYEFYADCAVGENSYYTELILYDPETAALSLPVRALYEDPVAQTRRSSLLYAEDVDGDGRVEIPAERNLEDSYVINYPESESVPLRCVNWLRYAPEGFVSAATYYVNDVYHYRVRLDPALGPLRIVNDYMTGEVRFLTVRPTAAEPQPEDPEGAETPEAPENTAEDTAGEEATTAGADGNASRDDLLFTVSPVSRWDGLPSEDGGAAVRITVTDLGRSLDITKKTVEALIETGY